MSLNKIFKKIVAVAFIFIVSVDSFAAVVSDNDGSAFITKAEFDSLKNDFQSQINQYNTSIDNKIDSAIAAYLMGIKVDKVTELTTPYYQYKIDDGQGSSSIPWWGGSTTTNVTLNQTDDVPNNMEELIRYYKWNTSSSKWDYERWLGTGNWRWNYDDTSNFKRWKTPAKNYIPYIVCNTDGELLYFGNIGTNIYNKRIAFGDSTADRKGTYMNVDTWNGQDNWYGSGSFWGARWLIGRAETAVNAKLLTAVSPDCTNLYYYIKIGTNRWTNRGSAIFNLRDDMTMTRQDGTLSATTCPTSGYAIHGIYYAEGQPVTQKKLQDFAFEQFKEVSQYNCEQKYGVYITTLTADADITLNLNMSTSGTLRLRSSVNKGNADASTVIYNNSIASGNQKVELKNLKNNTNLFISFLPDSGVGYIDSIKITQTEISV